MLFCPKNVNYGARSHIIVLNYYLLCRTSVFAISFVSVRVHSCTHSYLSSNCFITPPMVLQFLQSRHSLVLSRRYSFLFIRTLFVVSQFPSRLIMCCYLYWFVWYRPTPAPDFASSLTLCYISPVTPGLDPRLSLGYEIGFPWTLPFADSGLYTIPWSLW